VTFALIIVAHCAVLSTYNPALSASELKYIVITDYVIAPIFLIEFFIRVAGKGSTVLRDAYMYADMLALILSFVSIPMLIPVLVADTAPRDSNVVWGGFLITSFRSIRLLRALKVIPTVKHLLQTAFARGVALVNLVCIILIALAVFSLVCMQFFGGRLDVSDEAPAPRLVFNSFGESMMTLFVVMTGEGWNFIFEELMTGGLVAKVFSFVLILFYFLAAVLLVEMFTSIIVDNQLDSEDSRRETAEDLFHDVVQWYGIWQDMMRDRLRKLNEGMATLTALRFLHNMTDRPVFHDLDALPCIMDDLDAGKKLFPNQVRSQAAAFGGSSDAKNAVRTVEDGMHSGATIVVPVAHHAPVEQTSASQVPMSALDGATRSNDEDGKASDSISGSGSTSLVSNENDSRTHPKFESTLKTSTSSDAASIKHASLVVEGNEDGEESAGRPGLSDCNMRNELALDNDATTLHLARELMLARHRRYSDATVVTIDERMEGHSDDEDGGGGADEDGGSDDEDGIPARVVGAASPSSSPSGTFKLAQPMTTLSAAQLRTRGVSASPAMGGIAVSPNVPLDTTRTQSVLQRPFQGTSHAPGASGEIPPLLLPH